MEYYLLHLSYNAAGWNGIVEKGASYDERLDPVRKLIAHLGGALASFHFYDTPHFADAGPKHAVYEKFAMFGEHDLMAVLAMPDKHAAQAFTIAVSAQHGVSKLELTSMMPFAEAITTSVAKVKDALDATRYSAPGKP